MTGALINYVLVERLLDLDDPFWPLDFERDPSWLEGVEPCPQYETLVEKRDEAYDRGRIRYFVDLIRSGQDTNPVEVDNVCDDRRIYPLPTIPDGHHRFIAYVLAGRKRMPVAYSGRVDLLRYLEGKRKTRPSE